MKNLDDGLRSLLRYVILLCEVSRYFRDAFAVSVAGRDRIKTGATRRRGFAIDVENILKLIGELLLLSSTRAASKFSSSIFHKFIALYNAKRKDSPLHF